MGNKCSPCCASCMGYSKVDGEDPDDERTALFRSRSDKSELSSQYDWEQHVLDDTVMKSEKISKSAIISYSDGSLRAASPRNFRPNKKGIKDILHGLQGDTSGLAERGIDLGSGTGVFTPGKVDAGKAIYGSDGHGGGCSIFKSKECVLIVIYTADPAIATRLASEVSEYMADQGH